MVTFEFTPFVLDPAKRLLLRAGVPQTLTPRAFDLLLLLVQQRDRVLSKDEILSTVWADTVVEESNLNQQVFVLRKALNGTVEAPNTSRPFRVVVTALQRMSESDPRTIDHRPPLSKLRRRRVAGGHYASSHWRQD